MTHHRRKRPRKYPRSRMSTPSRDFTGSDRQALKREAEEEEADAANPVIPTHGSPKPHHGPQLNAATNPTQTADTHSAPPGESELTLDH